MSGSRGVHIGIPSEISTSLLIDFDSSLSENSFSELFSKDLLNVVSLSGFLSRLDLTVGTMTNDVGGVTLLVCDQLD